MIETDIIYKQPDEREYEEVKLMVEDFWLDNADMKREQFRIISENRKVIAFARIKEYEDATELGTLGVAKEYRGMGYGSKMVLHLLKQAKDDVYIVTTMFRFNANLGFVLVENYPDSISKKVNTCAKDYHVDEPYFVMKWEKRTI